MRPYHRLFEEARPGGDDVTSKCLDEDVVSRLLEARLSDQEASTVRAHLATCASCAELIGEVVRVTDGSPVSSAFEEIGILGRRQGELIGDRWRLAHWIGAGRMGSVWEVEDVLGEHPPRAVKLIRENDEGRARLRREAKLLMHLEHPNVVRAFDWYETISGGALILERLHGETLDLRIRRGGPIAFEDAIRILRAVARGLAHAHASGVAHRDLKPSNVFLTSDPVRVVLVDLGLAAPTAEWAEATLTRLTEEGASVGTPIYMAPEQLFGERMDERVDLWALGLLAHEVVCGSLPFEVGPLGKLLRALRRAPFPPLSVRANVPSSSLDGAVQKWLSFEPSARGETADAAALLDALARSRNLPEPW